MLILPIKEPDGWTVCLPPKGMCDVSIFLGKVDLRGHYPALMVDTHQDAHAGVENNP